MRGASGDAVLDTAFQRHARRLMLGSDPRRQFGHGPVPFVVRAKTLSRRAKNLTVMDTVRRACKTVYTSSILVVASTFQINHLERL
jgi:hypothetical protein